MRLAALLDGARSALGGRLAGCRPGRVAPGLLPIRAFAQGRAAIRPSAYPRRSSARHSSVAPLFRDSPGCSFKRSGKSRLWALPFVWWLAPDRACTWPDERRRSPGWNAVRHPCLRRIALDGGRSLPARCTVENDAVPHSVSDHEGRSFAHPQISPKVPAGWLRCKLSVFVSLRT